MKRKRKILTGLAFTLLFLISMSFCALAGNEEKIHIIYGLDEEGNSVRLEPAIVMDDGTLITLTTISILENDPKRFILVDVFEMVSYDLEFTGVYEDYEFAVFSFTNSTPPESKIMSLGEGKKNEIVSLTYMTSNMEVHELKAKLLEAKAGTRDFLTELDYAILENVPEDLVVPAALIDDQGNMVGWIIEADAIAFYTDVDSFYGNVSSTEDTRSSTEETSSPGRPDPAEPESDDSISIGLILGCVAAVIVVVILIAGLAGGKKKDPIVISSGPSEPKPEPVPRQDPAPRPAPVTVPVKPDPVRPGPASQPAAITVEIVATAGIMQGRTYTIGAEGISVGRDVSCGIRFPKETNGVSRNHCRISWNSQGALTIMDCGSSYGTYLSGYGKLPERHPVAVKSGDTFCVGSEKNAFKIQIKM